LSKEEYDETTIYCSKGFGGWGVAGNGELKTKGVFHFATPQDDIRDVNAKRSVTDPNKATPSSLSSPSSKKRNSLSSSTTKQQKKDPPQ
jgi:hypothetical protein